MARNSNKNKHVLVSQINDKRYDNQMASFTTETLNKYFKLLVNHEYYQLCAHINLSTRIKIIIE